MSDVEGGKSEGYDEYEGEGRVLPQSDLDYNLMTTDAVWGTDYVTRDLKNYLRKKYPDKVDEKGNVIQDKDSLWGMLGFFTRDIRLANLNNDQMSYCQYYLDLASDCLSEGYVKAFMTSLTRAVSVMELSQSKGGFLRKISKTNRRENFFSEEPQKKGIWGQKKQEG